MTESPQTPTTAQARILRNLAAGKVAWFGIARRHSYDVTMAALYRREWIVGGGEDIHITDAGMAALGAYGG